MQGVRTTRGCINCRSKKKGCDFGKPTCSRCQRLRISCAYENRTYSFVTYSGKSQSLSTASSLTSPLEFSLARTSSLLITDEYFWTNYLPQEDLGLDGCIGGIQSSPWISSVRRLAVHSTEVRNAIQACALAGLGWIAEDQTLVIRAAKLYARTLKQTNLALQNPVTACDDSVLACCRLLTLFEMLRRISTPLNSNRDQVSDWQSHVNGTCRLIQLRGRARHLSGYGVELYDGVRLTAIIQGLSRRQPNELTKLSWHLPRRDMRDELFELINPVPQLLRDFDLFHEKEAEVTDDAAGLEHVIQGLALVQQSLPICHMLQNWESNIVRMCKEKYLIKDGNCQTVESLRLYDVCTSFGHGFFSTCTQYWTMCNILYNSLRIFHRQLQELMDRCSPGNQSGDLPDWIDPEMPALCIARVSGHFFEPGMGLGAAHSAVFPISSALCYFARMGRGSSSASRSMIDAFASNKTGIIMREFLDAIRLTPPHLTSAR